MQTSLKESSTFFDRILQLANNHGFKNINELAIKGLGYSSSQKLNRLKDPNTKPSLDIIEDISNKFENINLDWLLFGRGSMLTPVNADTGVKADKAVEINILNEPQTAHTPNKPVEQPKAPKMGNYASDRIIEEKQKAYERQITDMKEELMNAYMKIGYLTAEKEELKAALDTNTNNTSHVEDADDAPALKVAGE